MIVLLSGTSGSGKTHLVRRILDELGPHDEEITLGPRDRVGGYVWHERAVCVMGRYDAVCGGCDALSWKGAADAIETEVVRQVDAGRRVLLEGLLVGEWGIERITRLLPRGLVVVALATPLEECLEAVAGRRRERAAAKGQEAAPLDPKNTTERVERLRGAAGRRRAAGIPVEELDREAAYRRVREMIVR